MASFYINDDTDTPQPHNFMIGMKPETGRFQNGGIRTPDGFMEFDITYDILTEAQMKKLYELYYEAWQSNAFPIKHIDYDLAEAATVGGVVTTTLVNSGLFYMSEPIISSREGPFFSGTTVKFRKV